MIIPINVCRGGVSAAIASHYGAAAASDFRPRCMGNPTPHTAILEISNMTDDNTQIRTCASRKRGEEHKLEVGGTIANSLTTIGTDSMVVSVKASVRPLSHALEFKGEDSFKDISPTIRATEPKAATVIKETRQSGQKLNYKIRKLTPRECYRLMDVDDADIDKLFAADISETKHKALAGNSIVVSCLYHIFKNLLIDTQSQQIKPGTQLELF